MAAFTLKDTVTGVELPVEVFSEGPFLEIRPKGYGEHGIAYGFGSPVVLSYCNGVLTAYICADINVDLPTAIDLQMARESNRRTN